MKRLLAAAALLSTLALSACGFTPLYGQQGVTGGLGAIEVVAADGRAGYLLREQLEDALARNPNVLASHRLTYKVEEKRYARGVRVDNVANRYELNMKVEWKLTDVTTGSEVRKGTTMAVVTYDSADQPYAAISAQQDGQERAAAEVARKIQLELASWLAGKAPA
ncbi:LPS assembly lipoprotein LptE [Caulobacter endophyticus]|uniref:LPS assembly lipoprotein LptE n=1 Tax=Caulobacter endophyticus TaxID=2172652 RepID=UPI002410B3C3|nr:LPS assembly lipoprotein LptE [Caulobacter endophyticus]MDG2531639.1 LPS assembly lipoprotein LptE [Caulobacter endophyticus]